MEHLTELPDLSGLLSARAEADFGAYGESGICRAYEFSRGVLCVTYGQGVYLGELNDEALCVVPMLCERLLCEEKNAPSFLKPYEVFCRMEPSMVAEFMMKPEEFTDFFALHEAQGLKVDSRSYYADRSHRQRHGFLKTYAFFDSGRPVCFGGYGFIGKREAEISDIYTMPEYRGRGYAAEMVRFLVGDSEVSAHLLCSRQVAPFYEKQGFVETGKIAVIKF